MNYINMNDPRDLYNYMKKYIKYGFMSNIYEKGFTRKELNNDQLYEDILLKSYYLQTPEELVENGYGLCTDQVELERDFFKQQGYKAKTYYCTYHNHTFLVYEDKDGKYVWFERTYKAALGLNKFRRLNDLFDYYRDFQKEMSKGEKVGKVSIMEYDSLEFGSSFEEMITELNSNKKNKVLTYRCR